MDDKKEATEEAPCANPNLNTVLTVVNGTIIRVFKIVILQSYNEFLVSWPLLLAGKGPYAATDSPTFFFSGQIYVYPNSSTYHLAG